MNTVTKIAPDEIEESISTAPVMRTRRSRPPSDKAERIVEAMRVSVARRGTTGSTFDQVAREAGVSRGLLHYYFGSKEHLLVEAARRDFELRMEVLESRLAEATTADDFVHLMATHLEETVAEEPDLMTLVFELFTLARRNADVAVEYTELVRQSREKVADMLKAAQRDGVLHLGAAPESVAEILFALADGLALRMLLEPGRDFTATMNAAIACVRALLTD
jgi:AcrR family transcriptional regulator